LFTKFTAIQVQVGFAPASYGTSLAFNASPFYSGGNLDPVYATAFNYNIQALPITIGHSFSVTTSDTDTTTVYVYGFAGLFGVSTPKVQYILSVEGLYR